MGKPTTRGLLTTEEVDKLRNDDVVLVVLKADTSGWRVGDVETLDEVIADWNDYHVYNIKDVTIASREAQRRWAFDHYLGWGGDA